MFRPGERQRGICDPERRVARHLDTQGEVRGEPTLDSGLLWTARAGAPGTILCAGIPVFEVGGCTDIWLRASDHIRSQLRLCLYIYMDSKFPIDSGPRFIRLEDGSGRDESTTGIPTQEIVLFYLPDEKMMTWLPPSFSCCPRSTPPPCTRLGPCPRGGHLGGLQARRCAVVLLCAVGRPAGLNRRFWLSFSITAFAFAAGLGLQRPCLGPILAG